MEIKTFEFNPFGELTYVIYDEQSLEAAIIDPGMMSEQENNEIDSFIQARNLKIKYLINTHLHIDHVSGVAAIQNKYDVGLSAHPADAFLASRVKEQAMMFHLPARLVENVVIEHELSDGQILHLGKEPLEIIAVPGHSPGSIAIYSPGGKFVVTGDALFKGSIGRTDLPGGDYATLIKSITSRLLTLPDDTIVYPGHGPHTRIADERVMNPYI